MINRIQGYSDLSVCRQRRRTSVDFKDVLNTKLTNHAVRRIENKKIQVTADDASRINKAFEIAKAKGSNKALILLKDKIALLSVKENKLITMMSKGSLKEDIFTNIDSVVLMDE